MRGSCTIRDSRVLYIEQCYGIFSTSAGQNAGTGFQILDLVAVGKTLAIFGNIYVMVAFPFAQRLCFVRYTVTKSRSTNPLLIVTWRFLLLPVARRSIDLSYYKKIQYDYDERLFDFLFKICMVLLGLVLGIIPGVIYAIYVFPHKNVLVTLEASSKDNRNVTLDLGIDGSPKELAALLDMVKSFSK